MLAAGATSHIRVQNGVFVDDNCKEFMFSGYNAWQVKHWLLHYWEGSEPDQC